jgi:hypothetical protein
MSFLFLFLSPYSNNKFRYLSFPPPHLHLVIIHSEHLPLNNHHPTTWGSYLQSPWCMLIGLHLKELASSWYSSLLLFPPLSTFHDAP